MMSDGKCKSNFVSHSDALNATVEQVQRLGEDSCNDGSMQFRPIKLFQQLFINFWVPAKCQLFVSIQTVYVVQIHLNLLCFGRGGFFCLIISISLLFIKMSGCEKPE